MVHYISLSEETQWFFRELYEYSVSKSSFLDIMYKYLQISLVKRLFDFKQKREFCRKPAERDGITGVSFRRPLPGQLSFPEIEMPAPIAGTGIFNRFAFCQ